jgi:hypothetical protein
LQYSRLPKQQTVSIIFVDFGTMDALKLSLVNSSGQVGEEKENEDDDDNNDDNSCNPNSI